MYILTNGRSYIGRGQGGALQTVQSMNQAAVWATEMAALNVASTLPRSLKNLQYKVTMIQDKFSADTELLSLPDEVPAQVPHIEYKIEPAESVKTYIDAIQGFQRIISTALQKRVEYSNELNKIERQILDIEHKIEFEKMSASNGYQMYRLLHAARKKRRECKDILLLIDAALNTTQEEWLAGKPGHLANSMLKRSYIPRELPELFE